MRKHLVVLAVFAAVVGAGVGWRAWQQHQREVASAEYMRQGAQRIHDNAMRLDETRRLLPRAGPRGQ